MKYIGDVRFQWISQVLVLATAMILLWQIAIVLSCGVSVFTASCKDCGKAGGSSRAPSVLVDWNVDSFRLLLESDQGKDLSGTLGLSLPTADLGDPVKCDEAGLCWKWGSLATLNLSPSADGHCYTVEWNTLFSRVQDCYSLGSAHWYGGPEVFDQHWPIENDDRREAAYVTGDFFQKQYGSVMEPYWLNSDGFALHADREIPLFASLNSSGDGLICFAAEYKAPYKKSSDTLSLKYTLCSEENAKVMHTRAVSEFWKKPSAVPDERVITHPIWSTWARYKTAINQEKVLTFAEEIRANGFNNSQIEIDDKWETCYGELQFNTDKFPDAPAMVNQLKADGYRVTMWIHPFVNLDCPSFEAAKNYLIQDAKGHPALTGWWQGSEAGYVDFTKPSAREWWSARVRKLQTEVGIDSFKFDAGETNWMPASYDFPSVSLSSQPNIYSTSYASNMAEFGGMVEIRAGWNGQDLPIFVRMLDKDSRWGYENGIATLITTLLQFNFNGYLFVLPDMIGGNGYVLPPGKELFIRWLQANVFMPVLQFSYVPWDYDQEVIDISLKMTDLHAQYAETIIQLAQSAVATGLPINRPVWWLDPLDPVAQTIDSEYLLGDDILVAPVLENNAVSRDIYLPVGNWRDEANSEHPVITGPTWLRDYPAPLDTLPYFTRVAS